MKGQGPLLYVPGVGCTLARILLQANTRYDHSSRARLQIHGWRYGTNQLRDVGNLPLLPRSPTLSDAILAPLLGQPEMRWILDEALVRDRNVLLTYGIDCKSLLLGRNL